MDLNIYMTIRKLEELLERTNRITIQNIHLTQAIIELLIDKEVFTDAEVMDKCKNFKEARKRLAVQPQPSWPDAGDSSVQKS